MLTGAPEHGGEGGSAPCSRKREQGRRTPLIILSSNEHFSQFLLPFVLLSSLLENGESHEVSGRQSNAVLDHLSFIASFSDVAESVILYPFSWQASDLQNLP